VSRFIFHKICRMEDVPSGQIRFFQVEATPVLWQTAPIKSSLSTGCALIDRTPFDGARLWPYPDGPDREGHIVDGPWQHFHYDIRTGENFYPN
jgi:hypothetical protein